MNSVLISTKSNTLFYTVREGALFRHVEEIGLFHACCGNKVTGIRYSITLLAYLKLQNLYTKFIRKDVLILV